MTNQANSSPHSSRTSVPDQRLSLWGLLAALMLLAMMVGACASARAHKLLEELATPLPEKQSAVYKEFDTLGSSANAALRKGLGHMDPLIRRATRTYLVKHRGEKAIPLLVKALRSPSEQTRRNALMVLGQLAPKGATVVIPALQKARRDPQEWVRAAAYNALTRYNAARPTSLVQALKDPSATIRLRATHQLVKRAPKGGQSVKVALERAALDANPKIRRAAVVGLKRFGLNTVVGPISPRLQRKLRLKEYHFHYGKRGAGQFSLQRLQAVIKRNWPDVRRCYKKHTGKGLLAGRLVVRWVIYKSGDTLATNLMYTSIRYKPFVRCIMFRVRDWKFPKPSKYGGELVVASYSFLIQGAP